MASVPVTITGVLADKHGRTIQAVTLFGEMVRSDVGVGGGPICPPEQGNGGLGIWGPTDPRPTPPIAPGGPPPGVWPGPGPLPHPEHPIAPGGPPPGIWGGGNQPFPTPPIVVLPPVNPGGPPLVIWGPGDPRPQPPINLPPPPAEGGVKPPPPEGGWGYSPDYGWGYFPGGGGKPQPPA